MTPAEDQDVDYQIKDIFQEWLCGEITTEEAVAEVHVLIDNAVELAEENRDDQDAHQARLVDKETAKLLQNGFPLNLPHQTG